MNEKESILPDRFNLFGGNPPEVRRNRKPRVLKCVNVTNTLSRFP